MNSQKLREVTLTLDENQIWLLASLVAEVSQNYVQAERSDIWELGRLITAKTNEVL